MLQFFTTTTNLLSLENVRDKIKLVKIARKSENDSVCIVTCGVLVHESIKAAERLASESNFLVYLRHSCENN